MKNRYNLKDRADWISDCGCCRIIRKNYAAHLQTMNYRHMNFTSHPVISNLSLLFTKSYMSSHSYDFATLSSNKPRSDSMSFIFYKKSNGHISDVVGLKKSIDSESWRSWCCHRGIKRLSLVSLSSLLWHLPGTSYSREELNN